MSEKILQIIDLKKNYNDKPILTGINLCVKNGELLGMLGENGAGKTTLIKCILGLADYDSGTVKLNTTNIGFIPENYGIWDYLTGREYITFIGKLWGITENNLKLILDEFPKMLNFDDILDKPIYAYSKGNKEKIMVTIAFGCNPHVIFFDEPFSGLDPIVSRVERKIMKEFCKNGGTIFLNTHHLELAEKICTRVCILKGGQIAFDGNIDDVMDKGGLEEVYFEFYDPL